MVRRKSITHYRTNKNKSLKRAGLGTDKDLMIFFCNSPDKSFLCDNKDPTKLHCTPDCFDANNQGLLKALGDRNSPEGRNSPEFQRWKYYIEVMNDKLKARSKATEGKLNY